MTDADSKSIRLLLIDDEEEILLSLTRYLRSVGYIVETALDGSSGLKMFERTPFDIVITDLRMPNVDGFQVLRGVQDSENNAEVIMITGHGHMEEAMQAMRAGAHDFFTKPLMFEELTASIERTARFNALRKEKDGYKERLHRLHHESDKDTIIGNSPGMRQVREMIAYVCQADSTSVIIYGETGTGKELVARAVHFGSSRADEAFVSVNCTAIPESLAESELFGHVKGAFTGALQNRKGRFELANRGTLLLDEIGDMSTAMQARLLRLLEERCIQRVGESTDIPLDIRIISATNRDLPTAIASGDFREDLYYRLNAYAIRIPPLRERPEDIQLLAEHFLLLYSGEMRKTIGGFSEPARQALQAHAFRGNVRELRNIVERAVILTQADLVPVDAVRFEPAIGGPTNDVGSFKLADLERDAIARALGHCGNNQVQAARLLGITRDTLRRRMDRYDL